jgi:hypothetical protein
MTIFQFTISSLINIFFNKKDHDFSTTVLFKNNFLANTYIDQESVIFQKDQLAFECMAIYTIENGKIAKLHFIVQKKE